MLILKSPLNASEMDTLQKILNSVHSGYLNSPGGPAALHGTSARREAGGQWRGQLLEAGWPLKGQWRLPARHALRPWKVASVRLGSVHPEAGVCVPRPASCPAAAAHSAPGTCFTRHLTPHAEQPAVPRREPHSGTDPGVPPDHLGVFVTLLLALSLPLFFHFSLVFLCLLFLISFLKCRFSLPSQPPMASFPGPFSGLGSLGHEQGSAFKEKDRGCSQPSVIRFII